MFVNTLVSEPASGWSFEFCTYTGHANNHMNFPLGNFLSSSFAQGGLFAFPGGLSAASFGVLPFAPPSAPPFPSPFEFRCGEAVGEGERGRPFLFAFLVRVMLECA